MTLKKKTNQYKDQGQCDNTKLWIILIRKEGKKDDRNRKKVKDEKKEMW